MRFHNSRTNVRSSSSDSGRLFLLRCDQAPAQLFQRLCIHLAVGDVHARADIPTEGSIGLNPGYTIVNNPAIFSIMAQQPVFHFEIHPGIERTGVNTETALQVRRMHSLRPALPHFLLDSAPSEIEPAFVEEST